MIPNQWYAILESSEIKPGKVVGITRMGERLALWRDTRGQVACLGDMCVHRGAALSHGELCGDHLACPFHGLQYHATGRVRVIPANGKETPVPRGFATQAYAVREAHGFIWLWWGEARQDLPSPPWFTDMDDDALTYACFRQRWPVHYSRVIENQLDVVHLPFVHRHTIGRDNHTLVNGPLVKQSDSGMTIYVYNQADEGLRPLKPEELPEPSGEFRLEFRFPNIWQNHLSEALRIIIAFAPVDEENTLLYGRYYQKMVRAPLARHLANWLGAVGSWYIANEDRRVVRTQLPKKTDLRMGERLIQGDLPIVIYRRRRKELIESVAARP